MRVHPSQLSPGLFPAFGLTSYWVKSFNLNNKKIVFPICFLFLLSVIGSALNKGHLQNLKHKLLPLLTSNHQVSEPLAVILSNGNSKVFLFSAPSKSELDSNKMPSKIQDLDLTLTDRVFLDEAKKFGVLSLVPLSDAAELPLLKLRSINELKELLARNTATGRNYDLEITSRVFVPGNPAIYGIAKTGEVVEITSSGAIIKSLEN